MLQVTSPLPLSKIRYQAKKRGLRVRADGTGNFTVFCIRTEPPRPLVGADHIPLWCVEQVVCAPLPEPRPRRKRMARLAEPAWVSPEESPASVQANHEPFRRLIELLQARGGAR
jgi:hypothetical protein